MTVQQLIGACVLLLMISAPGLAQTPAGSFEQLIAEGAIQPQDIGIEYSNRAIIACP